VGRVGRLLFWFRIPQMVLFVNGVRLDDECIDTLGFLDAVKSRNREFLASDHIEIPTKDKPYIILTQGEYINIEYDCNMLLGSADATTCVIIAFHDPISRRASLAHLDESILTSTPNSPPPPFLTSLLHNMTYMTSCHIIGAYLDTQGIGLRTANHLLHLLHLSTSLPIALSTCCIGPFNTAATTGSEGVQGREVDAPLSQSLALHLPSGAVTQIAPPPPPPPQSPSPSPCHHHHQMPCQALRMSQSLYSSFYNSHHYNSMVEVHWNKDTKTLTIPNLITGDISSPSPSPSSSSRQSSAIKAYFEELVNLSDKDLLERCSTSPDHEQAHVAEMIKESYRYVLEQKGEMRREEVVVEWRGGWGE
jgi:hypothetical protein